MNRLIIAICTYKRPVMLQACLESVLRTQRPEKCILEIAVIDNDDQQSAKPVVNALENQTDLSLYYLPESRRGIPVARNRGLDFALGEGMDYLVFIDDDETVSQSWLTELHAYAMNKGGNAVIHGRVISECPADAPGYLSPFFTRNKVKPTGQALTSCATDNVLISLAPIKSAGLKFDESRPLAGGTDTIFFCAAHDAGIEIFSCAEAIVHETVPLERISLKWLSKRKYRAGIDMGKRKVQNGRPVALILLSVAVQIPLRMIACGLLLLVGQRHQSIKEWLKTCRAAGSACGAMGVRVDSYKTIDGQ